MSVLDQLLVEVGISAGDLTGGASAAADQVELSLAGIGDAADQAALEMAQATDRAAASLAGIGDAGDQAALDVSQAADRAAAALADIGTGAEQAAQGADQAAQQVEQSLGGMQAAAAGAAVGGLFMAGLTNAMDAKHANVTLSNQLDLTEAEAARAGDLAGTVFTQGFGAGIEDVNNSLGSVTSAMGGMSKIADGELQSMTKSAIMLGDTFEMDVGESATAAGQMINQGLVKDGTEAFDVLTKAAQTLPKSMAADIPAIVTEYGVHWNRIGLDAQTAFGMMSQYVKAGGRDIDQAGDVLHEFARITSEETDKAAEAFKGLGLPAKQMLADIHKGGEPAKAALQKTIEALRGVDDTGKQSALAVQLFGDMAGEGADALWAMDPASAAATSGMDQAAGSAKEATDAMAAAASLDSIWRNIATTLGETLAPALKIVSDFFAEHPTLLKILVPVLLGLALAIGIAVIAQWAWNTALWAFPGTWIIAGIIALIAIIILIVVYWDEIAAATGRVWDWVVSKLSDAWGWITTKTGETWDWITSKIGDAWAWVSQKTGAAIDTVMGYVDQLRALPGRVGGWLGELVSWVAGLPGRIASASRGMWDGLTASFRSAVNNIISRWNSLSFTLGGGSVMGVSVPSMTLHTPDIPYLAEGGITTGPTLAMIGEGAEQEAVLPLSKLDGMLRSVSGSVRSTGAQEVRVTVDVTGGDDGLVRVVREWIRINGESDPVTALGGTHA
ncbi:phage tail tape measure protein [Streptomyces albipurpureus]|uniref:Phage tail tape measure protein n=1 Tax=Streptomyces albipurpureus TaxID=2897419 RepID=A0ABT0UNL2_9ACTN|nr:phage tail tape measure protein [Streptomyces sp. CWNU-1]MCM2390202.1 phage tail tape measure protein [Streptomyces sp. CWNU-1]